jgi:hypothetical protein
VVIAADSLEFARTLSVSFALQLPVEVAEFRLEVSLVRRRHPVSAQTRRGYGGRLRRAPGTSSGAATPAVHSRDI